MTFDLDAFLATAGVGRRIVQLKPKEAFFSQGSQADSIFYLQAGHRFRSCARKNCYSTERFDT
jgi:CRP-like cAMP-binding protein